MEKVLGFFAAAALLGAVSCAIASSADAPAATAGIKVAAVAADVQSVVLIDARGHTRRYPVGALVAKSGWRVARIAGDQVLFESSRRFAGRPLDLQAKAGQSIDFDAMEAAFADAQVPRLLPGAPLTRPVSSGN